MSRYPQFAAPLRAKEFTHETIGAHVDIFVRLRYRSRAAAGKVWGCSAAFISLVVRGHKAPSPAMLADMNLVKLTVYRPIPLALRMKTAAGVADSQNVSPPITWKGDVNVEPGEL